MARLLTAGAKSAGLTVAGAARRLGLDKPWTSDKSDLSLPSRMLGCRVQSLKNLNQRATSVRRHVVIDVRVMSAARCGLSAGRETSCIRLRESRRTRRCGRFWQRTIHPSFCRKSSPAPPRAKTCAHRGRAVAGTNAAERWLEVSDQRPSDKLQQEDRDDW
jgi:hypothetical protein